MILLVLKWVVLDDSFIHHLPHGYLSNNILMTTFYPDTAGFHTVMALISPLYSHHLSHHVM